MHGSDYSGLEGLQFSLAILNFQAAGAYKSRKTSALFHFRVRIYGDLWNPSRHSPSTSDVKSVTLAAFLLPAGKFSPIFSNFSLSRRPPFFDFALGTRGNNAIRLSKNIINTMETSQVQSQLRPNRISQITVIDTSSNIFQSTWQIGQWLILYRDTVLIVAASIATINAWLVKIKCVTLNTRKTRESEKKTRYFLRPVHRGNCKAKNRVTCYNKTYFGIMRNECTPMHVGRRVYVASINTRFA